MVIGNGDQLEELRTRADKMGLRNICFAGAVEKREIPSSLKNASLLLLYSCSQTGLSRYGMSQNKLFDYLASGKPILSNLPSNYSIINKYDCGVERSFDDPHEFATQIEAMLADKEGMKRWGRNSAETAELYSFACHADHLAEIIEKATKEEK